MSSTSQVPPDVWGQIIEFAMSEAWKSKYLRNKPIQYPGSPDSLLLYMPWTQSQVPLFMAVCKNWQSIAQPLLYQNLCLSPETLQLFENLLVRQSLIFPLEARPSRYIKTLYLHNFSPINTESFRIASVLLQASNLRTLIAPSTYTSPTLWLAPLLPIMQDTLHVLSFEITTQLSFELIVAAHQLQELVLQVNTDMAPLRSPSPDAHPLFLPNLTFLSIVVTATNMWEWLFPIINQCIFPSLREVSFDLPWGSENEDGILHLGGFAESHPRVADLQVVVRNPTEYWIFTCPWSVTSIRFSAPPKPEHLQQLPRSVKFLEMDCYADSSEILNLAHALVADVRLPDIQHLRVHLAPHYDIDTWKQFFDTKQSISDSDKKSFGDFSLASGLLRRRQAGPIRLLDREGAALSVAANC